MKNGVFQCGIFSEVFDTNCGGGGGPKKPLPREIVLSNREFREAVESVDPMFKNMRFIRYTDWKTISKLLRSGKFRMRNGVLQLIKKRK